MKYVLILFAVAIAFTSCQTTSSNVVEEVAVEAAEVNNFGELLHTAKWTPTTDNYGSSYECADEVIVDGEINVDFVITQKDGPDIWPYIELICATGAPLTGLETITLDYKCSKSLKIKLSQSDFGSAGDSSYAHYYIEVPAADEWTTVTVNIADFNQPSWAPEGSKGVGLKLENVNDIYLVPAASYEVGEPASLSVRSLITKQ